MSGRVNATGVLSFAAATALGQYLRVTSNGTTLALAGATDREVGTLDKEHIVSGLGATSHASVVAPNAEGTVKMIAAGAFSAGAALYGAASGTVDDTVNANPIGYAVDAATAANDIVEVLRVNTVTVGRGDHNDYLNFFDDFLGDYPANTTAMTANGWSKVETNGSGVTSSDQANGVLTFAFDAVAEAATAVLYMINNPFDIDDAPIVDFRLAIYDIGDDAALDINFGIANDTHATDADVITESAFFHLDGTSLALVLESDDGTEEQGDVATGVTLVDDTFYDFRVDMTDKTSVTFWYKAVTAVAWTQLAAATTFNMENATSTLTPMVHVEKTSNDTLADVRLDFISFTATRA